jgi:hypothetical protein
MGALTNQYVSQSYQGLVKLENSTGITPTLQYLEDGVGNNLPIQVSNTEVNITGSLLINGTSYSAATSGTSGTSGSSGTSGVAGSSGTSGTSGSSGQSGSSGTSGTSGSSGQSGSSGTSGSSGQSGSSGTSGTSGVNGSSGTSGDSGTSGTSGTSGVDGSSGTSGTSPDTSNFATTGSNTFIGNQLITGSVYVSSSVATDVTVDGKMLIFSNAGAANTPQLTVSGAYTNAGQSVLTPGTINASSGSFVGSVSKTNVSHNDGTGAP